VVEASRGFAGQWNPCVKIDFINFEVASGGRNRSSPNLGTFNSFFQSGAYSGRAQLLGASNSFRLEPTLSLALRRNVSVSPAWGLYWRESAQDTFRFSEDAPLTLSRLPIFAAEDDAGLRCAHLGLPFLVWKN